RDVPELRGVLEVEEGGIEAAQLPHRRSYLPGSSAAVPLLVLRQGARVAAREMPNNLAHLLTDTAARHADRPAFKLDDAVLSYATLDEGAARVAGLLKDRGLQPGDRVGVMLPNVPSFGVVYYGVLRAGGVVVPMNVLLKAREVGFYLSDPGAKQLFA